MEADHQIKILLVDDKRENLLSLEVILATENYHCVKASSGREVLKILLKEQDFAIILMDVQMPLMDGIETAELIRQSEKLKNIPIIFLTANMNTREYIFKGYQAGAVDYMIKPLSPEILKAKVAVFADLYIKKQELIAQGEHLKALNKELEKRWEDLLLINQELEKFSFIASHDLQEPLRTIISYIQLLQMKYKEKFDDDGNEFMDFVVNASYRMKNIIDDLLQYSRINNSEEELKPVDCNKIVKEVLENLNGSIQASKAKIQVGKLPVINANPIQIAQLFQNLLSNAIKFNGGEYPKIRISFKENEPYYLFSIEDNGIGIEQKFASKIFEIFQRLHGREEYTGTGIGLAICKKIVERYGGKIWMNSEINKGTVFYFTIKK